jgi:catechol 2,3-dioxygenase-like lactoylglutathione lyase family enzyme
MLTLWRIADPAHTTSFDRKTNIGLHHLALAVPDDATLMVVYERLRNDPGVTIEAEPGFIRGDAGARHFFCAMPGGVRIEFATPFT